MAQGNPSRVPLLATIVLLLDDEAERVGAQILRLSQVLDPVVRARLRFLRVAGVPNALEAATLAEDQREKSLAGARMQLFVQQGAYQVMEPISSPRLVAPKSDPGATQAPDSRPMRGMTLGQYERFDTALRSIMQDVLRTGGSEPLAEAGYTLVPNELAVYLVGRADSSLLAAVATETQAITRTVTAQADIRRYALLIAAPPPDEERFSQSTPAYDRASAGQGWQARALQQPWSRLLSWQNGEPPLLYTFMFEPWDEAGRYHQRAELYYALAESVMALFAAGLNDHPSFKEAIDTSGAALDSRGGISRVGSIGTSLIASPTTGMIDYLANRIAADVLIRRGILGQQGAMGATITQRTLAEEARQEADRWVKSMLRSRLLPGNYALPANLPPRELEDGSRSSWLGLQLSTVSPDPAGLLWRWNNQRGLILDDERFWNIVVQHEYDISNEVQGWNEALYDRMLARKREIVTDMENAIHWRTLGAQGAERARAFASAIKAALQHEEHLLQDALTLQQQDLDRHHRSYEHQLIGAHPNRGVPLRPNPPENQMIPVMPRNMEALAHDVGDRAFQRVPMPLTLLLTAVLLGAAGVLFTGPLSHLPLLRIAPNWLRTLLTVPNNHWYLVGIFLVIFLVALVPAVVGLFRLRGWQSRFTAERTLLWLEYAKRRENTMMEVILHDIVNEVDTIQAQIDVWMRDLERAAQHLDYDAQLARHQLGSVGLSRDIYIARGQIWEGPTPDDLYLHVREEMDETQLIEQFLRYCEAHAGDVISALKDDRMSELARGFVNNRLALDIGESPFAMWDVATASQALERAVEAARIPMQPQISAMPVNQLGMLVAHPAVAWLSRAAQEHHLIPVTGPSGRWCMVVRMVTRAPTSIVRG